MHITWHGLSCVKLQTNESTLLINPYQDSVGVSMPKLKVEIVASTDMHNDETNNVKRLQGNPKELYTPGEYEASGIFIYGIQESKERVLYVIEAEGIKIGHPGLITGPLTDEQLNVFEGVDILFVPVSTIDAKKRSEFISQVDPRIIIPFQYATPGFTTQLDTIDLFAKEMGIKDTDGEKKFIIKRKDLPVEETQVVILQNG